MIEGGTEPVSVPEGLSRSPIDATQLEPWREGGDLPHDALLDARIIAGMFAGD